MQKSMRDNIYLGMRKEGFNRGEERGMEILEDYNALERLNSPVKLENAIVYSSGRSGYMNFNAGE